MPFGPAIGSFTLEPGLTHLAQVSGGYGYIALRFEGTGALRPAYRGIIVMSQPENIGPGGINTDTVVYESPIWYATQEFNTGDTSPTKDIWIVVSKKATDLGKTFSLYYV